MSRHRPGIDWFRLIAALLVIANHTSPLLSYSETGDFLLTRVLARLAVPFFLMVSGYFVFSRYAAHRETGPGPLLAFLKQMGLLYGVAILLYLPLTLYTGQLAGGNVFVNVLKALFFNGTFYHLWYMPAAILGGVVLWLLLKVCRPPVVLGITLALYAVGLLGDSYYGLSAGVPALKAAYDGMFLVFDYTRNGLFLAPVFLCMGALMGGAEREGRPLRPAGRSLPLTGFILTLGAMAAEGLLLKHLDWQRHDSMYLLLLPCVFFLFLFLLRLEGRAPAVLRPMSMAVYVVHPLLIVGVRGAAKVVHAEALLIENSLMHYLAVTALSLIVAYAFALVLGRWKSRREKPTSTEPRPAPGQRWTYRP